MMAATPTGQVRPITRVTPAPSPNHSKVFATTKPLRSARCGDRSRRIVDIAAPPFRNVPKPVKSLHASLSPVKTPPIRLASCTADVGWSFFIKT